MTELIQIAQATLSDIDFIVESNLAMALETEDKPLEAATLRAGIQHLFDHPQEGQYILAHHGDEPAGTLMLTYEWSDWRNGRFWWIQSVYVAAKHRRHGIYRAMHDFVSGLSRHDPACIGLRLYVERENTTAQQTYTQLGMFETVYRLYQQDHA